MDSKVIYNNFIISQVYLIYIRLFMVSCAPKLGDPLFDPLKFEAKNSYSVLLKPHKGAVNIPDDYLESNYTFEDKNKSINKTKNILVSFYETSASDIKDIPVLRQKEETQAKDTLHYSGYYFDETNCRSVGNRILCGYDKNKGEIKPPDFIIDLADGCRIRGDRIECGYLKIPRKLSLRQVFRIVKDLNYTIRTIETKAPDYTTNTEPVTKKYTELTKMNVTQDEDVPTKSENIESNLKQTDTNDMPITDKNNNTALYTINDDDDDYLTPVPEEETSIKLCDTGKCSLRNNDDSAAIEESVVEESSPVQYIDTNETSTLRILREEHIDKAPIELSGSRTTLKPVTKCVEKNDRIVCYIVPVKITTKALK